MKTKTPGNNKYDFWGYYLIARFARRGSRVDASGRQTGHFGERSERI
jgi:hypothetical protein